MANDNILNAKKVVDDLTSTWQKHIETLTKSTTELSKLNKEYKKVPSEYLKQVKAIEGAERERLKTQKELANQNKALAQLRAAEARALKTELDLKSKKAKSEKKETQQIKAKIPTLKQIAALKKQQEQLEKREQQRLERTQGLYNKVQRGINQVTKEYNNLALKKELNGKLSAQEALRLGNLEGKLNKYQNALKRVDGNIGKYQRNVGNYKSAYDGLGVSISQISRELPAFTNSVQTGFMAISNNIPMLVDEITKLKTANVELAASGKPTVSILKRVGGAIFSLQGLLGVGITLLTVFGPKLFEWATGMDEAKKETEKANEALKENNKQIKENIELRNKQIRETKNFLNDTSLNQAFRGALTDEDSERSNLALIELSERLQKIGVKNAEILKDEVLSTRDRLIIAGNMLEIESERAKLDSERLKISNAITEKKKIEKEFDDGIIGKEEQAIKLRKIRTTNLDETLNIQQRINQLNKENQRIIGKTVEIEGSDNTGRRKKIETLQLESEGIESVRINLEKQITAYQQLINLYPKGSNAVKPYIEQIRKLKIALGEISGTDLIGNIDLPILNTGGIGGDILEKTENNFKDTFSSITDIAGQAFGIMGQFSDQYFQKQFTNLELEKENALLFAGESATAREEIERQYDEKKRKIQQRQAKAKKEQAIFDIIIDTAAAVARALGNPLLIASVASLGAAQLALVASQQIPQFWMGTEGTPGGQIMVNDDPLGVKGSNYKEVIKEPSGKLHFPTGKNVKMTVPKGSKVYSTYDQFMNSLDYQLSANNIMPIGQANMPPMIINQGLTREDLSDVMLSNGKQIVNAINGKESIYFNYDERGAQIRRKKDNKITKIMNARYTGRGLNV